jgi:hypothetical protein
MSTEEVKVAVRSGLDEPDGASISVLGRYASTES